MSKPYRSCLRVRTASGLSHALSGEPLEERLPLATLPAGFTESQLTGTLNRPTAMAIAPDGRIFVTEQGGALRVYKDGALLTTPFLSVSVNSSGERGLLGIAFDPDFVNNQFVYVYYTTSAAPVHNRVSRFTANGDVVLADSEVVLLDLNNLSGATNHNGGAIHFGGDGKLYVAVGDNATGANSQTLNNMLGKMLRINSDGSIPEDNPFYNTATGNNRAIWTMGLRNPFTFGVQPGTGRIFINDVGEGSWEEINDGIAGSNYGWPSQEGITGNPSYRDPLFAYPHGAGTASGFAIAGGAFYNPPVAQFPADYVGDYFYGEYINDWIRRYDPATDTSTLFASGTANGLVDLQVDANGALYYLTGAASASGKLNLVEFVKVEAAHLFYNNSRFDAGGDAAAIATNKSPLQPGGTATFANYSSYSRGINGLVVDLTGANHVPTAADFVFRVGSTGAPTSWALAPATSSFNVAAGAGVRGSDRITITWADGAIKNSWLYVQARTTLGLATGQVFYYGNAVGESGNAAGSTVVNSTDEIGARLNPHTFLDLAAIDDVYDFNRDGYVNATDQILARSNATTVATSLPLITAPAALAPELSPAEALNAAVGLALVGNGEADLLNLRPFSLEDASSTLYPATNRRTTREAALAVAATYYDRLPRRTQSAPNDAQRALLLDDSLYEILNCP